MNERSEQQILRLNFLHVPEKKDNLEWRNSKEGKEWIKKYEKF